MSGIYLIAGIISIYLLLALVRWIFYGSDLCSCSISTDIARHRIHPLPLTALLVAIFMTVDFVGRGCSVLILICRELMDSTTEVSLEKQFEAASHSGLVWSIILGWPQGILVSHNMCAWLVSIINASFFWVTSLLLGELGQFGLLEDMSKWC